MLDRLIKHIETLSRGYNDLRNVVGECVKSVSGFDVRLKTTEESVDELQRVALGDSSAEVRKLRKEIKRLKAVLDEVVKDVEDLKS